MPPPKPASSTSTENLLLKCQKETRKKCLPPEWSLRPPNQEFRPPHDTIALAIQVDASAPSTVNFYESASDRLVGSIGPEYRGSMVIVPWRPGLKFVCQANCRRRAGCRIGVVREAKARIGVRMKSVGVSSTTTISAKRSSTPGTKENKKTEIGTENAPQAATPQVAAPKANSSTTSPTTAPITPPITSPITSPTTSPITPPITPTASPTLSPTPSPTRKSAYISRIPRPTPSPTRKSPYISRIPRPISRDKSHASNKHVSFDDTSISGKSSIETDGGGSPKLRSKINIKPGQRF